MEKKKLIEEFILELHKIKPNWSCIEMTEQIDNFLSEGNQPNSENANCAIFDVMASVSDELLLKAGRYEDEANADFDTDGVQHNLNIGRYDGLMQAVQEINKHLP